MRGIIFSRSHRFATLVVSALKSSDISMEHRNALTADDELSSIDLAILDVDDVSEGDTTVFAQANLTGPWRLAYGSRDRLTAIRELLDCGIDDFLLKPFEADELRVRVALLTASTRHSHDRQGIVEEYAGLTFDHVTRNVCYTGRLVELTPRERSVLLVLLKHREQVVSKERLAARVFLGAEEIGNAAIETYIHRVRRKLATTGIQIETVRGLGYLLSRGTEK